MCGQHDIEMGFTQERFPAGSHMCLIYSDEKERQEIIGKFLTSGLATGERVTYLTDVMSLDDVRDWLSGLGVDIPDKESSGQFVCKPAVDVYCPNGLFVPEVMLNTLRDNYTSAKDAGYPDLRLSGEMSWALKDIPGSDRLMEYEALVNNVVVTHPLTAICQYDSTKFDGGTILDVLKVHPMMIVQGQVTRNPYYLKPEEFLGEYRDKK